MRLKKAFAVLLGLALAFSAAAQTTVRGVVKDDTGEPLMGAGVFVKGTTIGVVTGLDGDYEITLPAGANDLTFSSIGLAEQTVAIDGRSQVDVTMAPEATALDEVVVVGYATVKRRDLLGSVSSMSSEKLAAQPVTTVSQALSGKMAGVSVITTEGDPDADIKIRVRGGGSITQDSSPLYIVDGFPVESINDIASSEIASIDVLKDAFSTAIYGSRGANGVVIVTTKSAGKGEKVSVAFNTYYGLKKMANAKAIQVMDVNNFVRFQYELATLNNNISSKYEPYFGPWSDHDIFEGMKGNDWIDAVFGRTGSTFSADLSISGSGENYNWTVGYAHMGDKAIMTGSDYSRDNLNFKSHFKTSKKISFDVNVRYARVNVRGAGANSIKDAGTTSGNGRLKHAVQYTPIPIAAGNEDDDEESYGDNAPPLTSVADNDSRRLRTTFNANGAFNWKIIDNLKLKVEGGIEDYRQSDDRFYGLTTYHVYGKKTKVPGTPSSQHKEAFRTRYRNTNTLNYDFKNLLGKDHELTALLGQELTITKSNTLSMMVDGFPVFFNAEQAWNYMSSASGQAAGTTGLITNNSTLGNTYAADDVLLSFFARANYDYKHKYSIGATLRVDGSSKFAHPWGFFPSAAASWTISNEPWMENAHSWLDQLKLRYSFGTAGNNNIPSGMIKKEFRSYTDTYISQAGNYYGTIKDESGKLVLNNPDLKWETTYTHNIGVDFSFWRSKLSGSIEVYQNDTKDLLINFPISGSGYERQFRNAGSTRNRGVELTLNAPIITKKDFSLNFSGNIAWNKNEVIDLGGLYEINAYSGWASNDIDKDFQVLVGQPLGNVYGYVSDGYYTVDDFQGFIGGKWVLKDGVVDDSAIIGTKYLTPGAMKLKNIDGSADNKVTAADRRIIGNTLPDFTGGFSLNAYWKGFDFAANFNYMIGNEVYNANKIEFSSSRKWNNRNLVKEMETGKRWSVINWSNGEMITDPDALRAANAGKSMWTPFQERAILSDWALEDGSFLRLQSVTLGYTLPEDLTQKVHLKKVRFYVTGTNLFCLTGYSGYDPEVDTRRATPLTPGVDYSAYPKSIGWVAGLNLTF